MKKTYIDQLIIQNRDKNGIFRKIINKIFITFVPEIL